MSYQEKNIAVSLGSFILVIGFYLIRIFQLIQGGDFNSENIFRLWVIVMVLGIVVTIIGTILTHIGSGILYAIKTREEPEIDDLQDERDKLIDLRGTKVTYNVSSSGVFISMITFALGQPPLVMFTLLIFFGVFAQIIGDISRLYLYRRGI